VVVVGGGNSGVQIAAELAMTRPTWLSVGEALPSLPLTVGGMTIFRWLEGLGAMDVPVDSWMGAKASRREFLIGASTREVARVSGVRLTGRVVGSTEGRLQMADGSSLEPAAVVWATGFVPDYRFLEVPVLGTRGEPLHHRGVTTERGLFFLGLPWQHTRGSALLGWVGRDAEYVVARLASSDRRAA
jgi:putative flavoprotein involved in K+ transport